MNICVFASGTGTNFKALIRSERRKKIKSNISLLITNNSYCGAVQTAVKYGIKYKVINRTLYPDISETSYDNLFLSAVKEQSIDFILLAGYMKLLSSKFLKVFRNRIINIHPALLPSFGGKGMYGFNVHKAVIESGVKVSGITIHFVDEKYDEGKIIFQKSCIISNYDDEFSLMQKIRKLEHKYYPEIVKKFEEKKIIISKNKVIVN
ncbi:MAG: phosphoribosylglycinamide formyltransferase [Ignavibacteria bacterium]|nr:phosphoribosylglycinamide formyltransferase [Ignavibacteria bacterium]